ncbi:MAG: hypothetical protein QNJ14_02405 [Woeseiaceae bacterium]|nr:hypothetical protein [Woeseiaceae bacterium]
MSWDIFVHDFPSHLLSVADIPDNFQPGPIGSRSDVSARILEVFPGADFTDPCWGVIDGADWSIEVNIGEDEPCTGFALHVRGGDGAAEAVAAILDHLQLRAIDMQTGEFFVAAENARASLSRWRNFRDRALGVKD